MCRERLSIGRSPAYTYTVTKRHPWDTSHYGKDGHFELPEGWAWSSVNDISLNIIYGVSESAKPSGTFKLLRITDIQNNVVDWDNVPFTDFDTIKAKDYLLSDGDILFARTGATVGKSYLANRTPSNAIFASYLIRIQYSKSMLPQYVKFFFESGYYWEQISDQSVGVGQPNVNGTSLGRLSIPVPPLSEQRKIVNEAIKWLSIIDSIEREKNSLLSVLDRTKQTILDLAIHGKLVPQDPSDEPAIDLLRRINPSFTPSHNLHYGDTLPKGWTCSLYGELNQHQNKSEDPTAFPEETYELYSVPIYDTGMPEFRLGAEIGSTKQLVDKGDVLLCKINPHLNRSWVVSHHRFELKCIASSEWLVFHNDAVIPEYARLFFMSPPFKELMLSNVSGVGGSLMRARSSTVNSYPIWVPPINEQKRIINLIEAFYSVLDGIEIGLCE